MTSNAPKDPSDLISLGLKFFGEAVKAYGRDVKDSAREEGEQVRDAWASVADKFKSPAAKAAPSPEPDPREQLLFGRLERIVSLLEDISLDVKATRQAVSKRD